MDVSIVIPLLNRKDYIEETVSSILKSGVQFRQLILVDNGSTDGTLDLIESFPAKLGTNISIAQESQPGAAAARDKGLSLCNSKWVYFFDSDDIFTGLPTQWDEDSDMVCFPTVMYIDGKKKMRPFIDSAAPHKHILSSMLNTLGMVFNTGFLRSIGGWNESCKIWIDWELGIRALASAAKVQILPQTAYHRIIVHTDSITGPNFSSNHSKLSDTLEIALEDVSSMKDSATKRKSLMALYYRLCILCGHYRREGNSQFASDTRNQFFNKFKLKGMHHLIGRLLTLYVARGGRGAWRIALIVTDCSR